MTAPQQSPEEDARLDALRRRLYRADATDADRQRYAAEREAVVRSAATAGPAAAAVAAPPPPRSHAGLTVAAVVLAALAGMVVGEHLPQPLPHTARPAADRAAQQTFDAGPAFAVHTAGVSRPASVATSVRGTPVLGQRFVGHGPAVVPVALLPGSFDGGRATVVLTAAQPAPIAWRALRVLSLNDSSSFPVVMAQGFADPGSAVATPSMFVFSGAAPARIAVEAPDTVRWTLVVAATSQIADRLR